MVMIFLIQVLLLSTWLQFVSSAEISGTFASFNSLKWTSSIGATFDYASPGSPTWTADLGWSLDGATAKPGDTFNLIMPCVFKFITDQTSIDLVADGTTYATCELHPGEEFTTFSSLGCTVSTALRSDIRVIGTVRIPLSFNAGGTSTSTSLKDSTCFTPGVNTVTFKDEDKEISTKAHFTPSSRDPSEAFEYQRIIPSMDRSSGVITLLSGEPQFQLGCSSVVAGTTNQLNAWLFPTNKNSLSYSTNCGTRSVSVTFRDVPAGLRPFFTVNSQFLDTQKYPIYFDIDYTCVGDEPQTSTSAWSWTPYNYSQTDSNGAVVYLTTVTVTGSTTRVTTLPFDPETDRTKTIVVFEPITTTTITTSYTTVTATTGETATVIVDVPYHSTTAVSTCWTGEGTTTNTIIATTDSIDTVLIETPLPNPATTTRYSDVTTPTTNTETATHGGTNTVVIV
ncbi:Agglutinin-like protein 1 [Candida viswanathii]|uniref:Agglutinin-like protein 1 n=1 Tax=Candida viswanathii TaxID=5486 RepID=A0A367XV02_9ASCO|nr:Agglutinin-like protein 1 [Candida viswanathii]